MSLTTSQPNIALSRQGSTTTVTVNGELDVSNAPVLRECLIRATSSASCVIVDLEHLDFIDSTGLGVLVGALKRIRSQGGEMRFRGVQPQTMRVFEITGLWRLLDMEPFATS